MKYDIEGYQWCDADGTTYSVNIMSKEQLQQALCHTIDVLEELDSKTEDMAAVILKWRGL